jgi:LysM repeat protein
MMLKRYTLPFCIALLTLTGCSDKSLSMDEKEERDPLVKTGVAYMEQNQWNEAERAFKDALDADPLMAKPHLDLAVIYQQYNTNYIHAIYHYDRYLELRPDSEKATFIREQRDKVERALALKTIKESSDVKKLATRALQLQKDNEVLRKRLVASTQAAQTTQPSSAATQSPQPTSAAKTTQATQTAKTATTGTAATSHKIYTVVAGDSLNKISKKFYGDSKYSDVIFEANRDSLSNPNALRIGQTLVIPVGN